MKRFKKGLVVLFALLLMCAMSACTPVQLSGDLVINSDGTGTRSIVGEIDKVATDDNGCTYYYFKVHGDELKAWFEKTYTELVPGSEEWLNITVTEDDENEIVTLSFDFTSFDEYLERMQALCFDETAAESYVAPEVTVENDIITAYTESTNTMTAIVKSVQTVFLADESVYDDACTKDGESLNGGSSDGLAESSGIALVGESDGAALTIQIDGAEVNELFAEKESDADDAPQFFKYGVAGETETVEETEAVEETEIVEETAVIEETETAEETETVESNESNVDDQTNDAQESGISLGLLVVIAVVVVAVAAVCVFISKKKKKAE